MSFLVDTNVISELQKGERAHPGVRAWMRSRPISDLFLSVVTLSEIETGILLLARKDARQAEGLRLWFDTRVRRQFAGRIIGIDETIALRCAPMHVPNKRPYADSLIAATAQVHDLVVATRNTRHFEPLGVRLVDPWTAEA